jgi:hypothetical protein
LCSINFGRGSRSVFEPIGILVKGSGERKEGRRKEKRNKVNLVLLLVDETSLFL